MNRKVLTECPGYEPLRRAVGFPLGMSMREVMTSFDSYKLGSLVFQVQEARRELLRVQNAIWFHVRPFTDIRCGEMHVAAFYGGATCNASCRMPHTTRPAPHLPALAGCQE